MKRPILVLLIASLVVAGCATPSSPGPSPTNSARPSATPTVPPVAPFDWNAATVPSAGLNSASLAFVPGGDGLVGVGYDGAFGSILWTSTDGQVWRDVTPPEFKSAGLVSVVPFRGKFVAVGRGDTFDVDTDQAAAWISEDGTSWRRVAGGPDMRGQMIDVVASDLGLFAVGGVPGDDAAGIWRSTDGETWGRTGGDFGGAFMWSIAEGGPGLVVTGWRRNPEPDLAVWTSADGIDWTLAPDPEGFRGFEGVDVIEHEGTLVMVGNSLVGDREARIWTSADGLDWKIADVAVDLVNATIRNLVVTPAGIVALGGRGTDGAAWASPDGRSWDALGEVVPNAFFNAAFVRDGTLLVGGATQEGTLETGIDVYAKIWTASPAGSALTR
jgi:hypothetical protein